MTTAVASTSIRSVGSLSSPDYPLGGDPRAPGGDGTTYTVVQESDFDLEFHRADGQWIVTDAITGIFGHDELLSAALADFEQAAEQHLDVLDRQSALSPALREQLDYLRARLRSQAS